MILDYGSHDTRRPDTINVDLFGHVDVDVVVKAGGTLPFPDETFDIVLSSQVMEHNRHIEAYYREAARVLKPWGFLYLHFPHRFQPYDGHTGRWFRHWFTNRPGFNWQSRGYHKRVSSPYFPVWVDMAPYWRQVKALLFKRNPYDLLTGGKL